MSRLLALAGTLIMFGWAHAQVQMTTFIETEPNNTLSTAQILTPPLSDTQGIVVWSATLQPQRDVDFYRVQISTSGTYSFRVDTGRDTVLAVLDSAGNEMARNNDTGNPDVPNNLASGLTLTLEAGTYFVRVWYHLDLGQCRYALRIFPGTMAPDHDPTEPNNTPDEAVPLGSFTGGELVTSDYRFLSYGGQDVDVYAFKVSSFATYLRIRTETYVDTQIAVRLPSGETLSNDDSDWDPLNGGASEVVIPSAMGGTYYVSVRGFGRWGGYYRVRVLAELPNEVTLIDGNALFRIRNLSGSRFRNPFNNVDWLLDGRDHAYQLGWWYRREGLDSRELTLANLVTLEQIDRNRLAITYQEGSLAFGVYYALHATGPNSAVLRAELVALNFSTEPLPLNLYHYFDLDVGGQTSNTADGTPDSLLIEGANSFYCRIVSTTAPDFWEVTAFPQTIDLLTDATADNLRNVTLPLTADITGALQQRFLMPLFSFRQTRVLYGLNVPFLSPTDIDLNGCVDDSDLLRILFQFGATGFLLPEDVDGNGTVDDGDLLQVLFAFGSGC